MKSITEKLIEATDKQSGNTSENKKVKDFERLLTEMKKTGILKQPSYDLPLVDTIGKTYYSSTNKRTN